MAVRKFLGTELTEENCNSDSICVAMQPSKCGLERMYDERLWLRTQIEMGTNYLWTYNAQRDR